jgi:cyclic dehypoxanthinyl futalosine synthase
MGISIPQALDCFHSEDLLGIGMEADAVRRSLHPEGVVSYLVDRRIRLSDLDTPVAADAIYAQAAETLDLGGTGLHLELDSNSHSNGNDLDQLCALLAGLRQRFPALWLHGLSATTIAALAAAASLSPRDILIRLREAGLDSLAGDDALIATETASTEAAPTEASSPSSWIEVHRAAHQIGLRSTAAMVFGLAESLAQRVGHLAAIRALQEETGGFTAFTPIAFHPDLYPAAISAIPVGWQPVTAVEYLRTLAISRMLLDNIAHIQSSSSAQGLKVVQMALRFGSNDLGAISLEAATARRPANRITEEDLRRVIRDAGFRPAQRDTLYRTLFLNN